MYRRYRPETFGEMIGQSQVTEPLMTALRGDRVGHAYLFSGPRGCGKTTSARILARCLNCAEGPTDTPCGVCESCVELGRGGGGSLDVVEIDAASHNGVDDARDLRERAVFAPARDRYKIFILDEAHMVTPQGFNALLKLVEEPPDHVKFIFATTEPEKVIGTIRSRTHHYPFRLVPPAAMLAYVEELCASEHVTIEPGVLPLVVRAGGGSPRDTLSLLDQLIAGSESTDSGVVVTYERAVALLGYTHAELLDEVVEAFAASDAAAAFAAVDRVVQTGQDPRRFVDDLLERLRDLIIVAAAGPEAASVLRGASAEDLAVMARHAASFGAARLSHTADIVIAALDEMTGATSPRLQLELMVARVLAQGSASPASAPAPAATAASPAAAPVAPASAQSSPPSETRAPERPVREPATTASAASGSAAPTSAAPTSAPREAAPPEPPEAEAPPVPTGPVTLAVVEEAWPRVMSRLEGTSRASWLIVASARVAGFDDDVLTLAFASRGDVAKFKQRTAGAGPSEDLRTAIQGILGIRVKYLAKHEDDLTPPAGGAPAAAAPVTPPNGGRSAPAGGAVASAPERPAPTEPAPAGNASARPAHAGPASPPRASASPSQAAPVTDWAVAPIPDAAASAASGGSVAQLAVDEEPEDAESSASARVATMAPADGAVLRPAEAAPPASAEDDDEPEIETPAAEAPVPPVVAPPLAPAGRSDGVERYGEAVVRQVLGATFVREEPYDPPTRFS
nr:DNA polymerase III subunit gamma and tau [Microbacterium thalassium]